jgi:hypothetical protein
MSLPIRQGRLFPDSPEPSKKFGDSLATIKYRCDLKPVYVSHMYGQKSRELWDQGKTQSLGVKARFGHFRADIHQRKEEKQQSNKKLKRDKIVSHKAFYAADLILEDIEVKGIRAEFHELPSHLARRSSDDSNIPSDHDADRESPIEYTRASELGPADMAWFNLYDFIDADKRPFDHDPKIELVNVADCPEVFYSLRKKVRTAPLQEGQTSELGMSKFGDEKTHICYLGESKSVATVQIKITRRRIRELQDKVKKMQLDPSSPKVSTSKFRPGTDDRTNYKSTSSVFRFCMITSRRWRAKKSEISMAIHSSSMQITRIKIVKLGKHSRMSYMYIVRVST